MRCNHLSAHAVSESKKEGEGEEVVATVMAMANLTAQGGVSGGGSGGCVEVMKAAVVSKGESKSG